MNNFIEQSFDNGEIVKLNCGGPKMSISWTSRSTTGHIAYNCHWFNTNGEKQEGCFYEWQLVSVNDN